MIFNLINKLLNIFFPFREIDKGKYASTDNFVHCEEIITKQEYVVVSNHRIIYVTRNDMFGSWSVSREINFFK